MKRRRQRVVTRAARAMVPAVLAVLAVGWVGAAPAVLAEDEPPALAVTLTAQQSVALGSAIRLEVRVENRGKETLAVREPAFDYRSIDFLVQFDGGVESRLTRYHPRAGEPSLLRGEDLAPGGVLALEHEVPAVAAGAWRFTPMFRGARGQPVAGAAAVVRVAAAAGAERLALRIETAQGAIDCELWPELAPATCLHMAGLARGGFFDGLTFHRVIRGFMIQGGCPRGNGSGDPGYTVEAEFADPGNAAASHRAGVLSMARNGDPYESLGKEPRESFRNSAGSQFFICEADAVFLDGKYTSFGRVVAGFAAVQAIAASPVTQGADGAASQPVAPVAMSRVSLAPRPAAPKQP